MKDSRLLEPDVLRWESAIELFGYFQEIVSSISISDLQGTFGQSAQSVYQLQATKEMA